MKKEWKCFAHGFFEADEPRCPYGCDTTIERAFLTAPGIASARTRNIDNMLQQLALDYGFTDMNNRRRGGSVAEGQQQGESAGRWVDIPKGNAGVAQALNAQKVGQEQSALERYIAQRGLTPVPQRGGVTSLPPAKPIIQASYGKPGDIAEAVRKIS